MKKKYSVEIYSLYNRIILLHYNSSWVKNFKVLSFRSFQSSLFLWRSLSHHKSHTTSLMSLFSNQVLIWIESCHRTSDVALRLLSYLDVKFTVGFIYLYLKRGYPGYYCNGFLSTQISLFNFNTLCTPTHTHIVNSYILSNQFRSMWMCHQTPWLV